MPCDRDFALIEKRKKVSKAYIPSDLYSVVKSAIYSSANDMMVPKLRSLSNSLTYIMNRTGPKTVHWGTP